MDKIYTPIAFARLLVSEAKHRYPAVIADFAAGGGALLSAAQERWPSAQLYGFDIDEQALKTLYQKIPNISTASVDFIEDTVRDSCVELSSIKKKCDLIILNPPFSCRGNSIFRTLYDGNLFSSSKAFAFLVRALEYLSSEGEIIAIIPKSCLTSQKDAALLKRISIDFTINQVGSEYNSVFQGHAISVVVIRISKLSNNYNTKSKNSLGTIANKFDNDLSLQIMRGTFAVHTCSKKPGSRPLIHTKNLKNGEIVGHRALVGNWGRSVSGKCILIQRVGKPDIRKIVVKNNSDCVVISDCIYAIATCPRGSEEKIKDLIASNWEKLQSLYQGSCAPYLTVHSLQFFLASIGFRSNVVNSIDLSYIVSESKSCDNNLYKSQDIVTNYEAVNLTINDARAA